MLEEYTGALIMLLLAIGIAVGMVVMTSMLGPKKNSLIKWNPLSAGKASWHRLTSAFR